MFMTNVSSGLTALSLGWAPALLLMNVKFKTIFFTVRVELMNVEHCQHCYSSSCKLVLALTVIPKIPNTLHRVADDVAVMITTMICFYVQLQFLFELPVRLQKCLDTEAYSQAVRYDQAAYQCYLLHMLNAVQLSLAIFSHNRIFCH